MVDYENATKEQLLAEIKRLNTYGLHWVETEEDLPKGMPLLTSKKEGSPHVIIEGENYSALQVLNFTHHEKIDVIYIDPPYNTGNKDFIYNDSFVDKEDGYRHSKYLSFMNRRLKLAKDLLAPSGCIFISIDDNEQANLKLLCDRVFGERNFVAQMIWKKKMGGGNNSRYCVTEHEYILCYAKNINNLHRLTLPNINNGKYKYEDEYVSTRGKYAIEALYRSSIAKPSPSIFYPIIAPNGSEIYPNSSNPESKSHVWRWSKNTYETKVKEGRTIIKETKKGWRVFSKQYFLEDDSGNPRTLTARTIIDAMGNRQGTDELKLLLDKDAFNNPKPVSLIKHLLQIASKPDSIILDFFAGSGTTGQAVLELNKEDNGTRQFILVQNNENSIFDKVLLPRIKATIDTSDYSHFQIEYCNKIPELYEFMSMDEFALKTVPIYALKENALKLTKDEPNYKLYGKLGFLFNIDFEEKLLDMKLNKIYKSSGYRHSWNENEDECSMELFPYELINQFKKCVN